MITGKQLRDAVISGANSILKNRKYVDDLNIFPVPDGDTGTNMSMTIGAGSEAMASLGEEETTAAVAKAAASAMLRGARGNSGVILSLLFRGFSKGLEGTETADGPQLAQALAIGVDAAYKAVMKPTEGTILTGGKGRCGGRNRPRSRLRVGRDLSRRGGSSFDHAGAAARAQKGRRRRRGRPGPVHDL